MLTDRAGRRGGAIAFAITWLAYATYYLGRKAWPVSKASIARELGLSEQALAAVETGYLVAYAGGQFANGTLGDRLGARRLVAFGMWGSAIACVAFGSSPLLAVMIVAYALNGYFQSTGWPGTTKGMSEWTAPERRGSVMGLWCTCYMLGGLGAGFACTWLMSHLGWRSAFRLPALAIAAVGLLVFLRLRQGPYRSAAATPTSSREAQRALLRNPVIWSYGLSYFFIKLIRYSFLFWLPYYLTTELAVDPERAGYRSLSFELGGILGAVVIGLMSDRLGRWSRAGVSVVWLLGSAAALLVFAALAPRDALVQFGLVVLIGFLLVGPDSLLSGAAAQEAGGPEAASLAAGFVNGVGSVGAIFQAPVTVGIKNAWGWQAVFYTFVGMALLAAASLWPGLRRRSTQ